MAMKRGRGRVPADLAVYWAKTLGYPITGSTLRSWARRGHINRYPDGYDIGEITEYLKQRGVLPEDDDGPP